MPSARLEGEVCVQDAWAPGALHPRLRPALPGGPGGASPQVGATGDEEEWVVLYAEENEPDAQTLEIPNLTPYTQYR